VANLNTPYGLQPVRRLDGAKWGDSLRTYYVPASYGSAMFVGDPVVKVSGAAINNGINAVNLAAAGYSAGTVGNPITGVICGFLGVLPAGSTSGQPGLFGLSGSPGPAYRPASTPWDWYVLVNDDPEAEWNIQVQGTNVMLSSVIGQSTTLVSGAGSIYTGWSGWTLNSANTGQNQGQVNIIGLVQQTNNDITLPYAKFIVRLNSSTEVQPQAGI
jgi:hypothetical protein